MSLLNLSFSRVWRALLCAPSMLLVLGVAPLSAQAPALLEKTSRAIDSRDVDALGRLLEELRRAVREREAASSELLLAWGRAEQIAGEPDSALSAYVDLTGRSDLRGRGLLEQARLLLERGIRNGAELWYLGAEVADQRVWADYRRDLHPLFTPDEMRMLDGLADGPARAAWLRQFWEGRAVKDIRSANARLGEHYRRIAYAREHYPSAYDRGHVPADLDDELDARGRMHLRHGAPERVFKAGSITPAQTEFASVRIARSAGSAGNQAEIPLTELWVYTTPTEKRLFIFAVRDCNSRGPRGVVNTPVTCARALDYQPVESVFDIFGSGLGRGIASGFNVRTSEGALNNLELVLLKFSAADERYGTLLGSDRYAFPAYVQQEREAVRRDLLTGLASDSYEHRYSVGLRARVETIRAGREGEKGLVHVAYAVRAGDLKPSWVKGYLEYPIRLKVRAESADGAVLATIDQERIFRADGLLAADETVLGREAIAVPPGTHQLRMVIEHNPLIGTALAPVEIAVPKSERGRLTGGDLVLGQADIPLHWERTPGDTVRLNPSAAFGLTDALELYHELYGLEAGEEYRYRLTLSRLKGGVFGGRTTALTLSGAEKAQGQITAVRRFLDVRSLKPGRYELEVLYDTKGTGSYVARRAFEIRP